ncbi:MAG: DUF368 domain-containing protein [Parachlamydiaceae bacterium]|nr:DUF368 domain-containing protein [Parachlamydiaceae bacterium]
MTSHDSANVQQTSKKNFWQILLCGLCMGIADLVPGISGGTIAFIMGFYNQLLDSIKTLNRHSFKLLFSGKLKSFFNAVEWRFLVPLLGGIGVSFVAFAGLLHFILGHETYRIYLYSAFLGLILASFLYCVRQLKKWKLSHYIGLLVGASVAFLFTGTYFVADSQGPYAIKIELNEYYPAMNNYDTSNKMLTHLTEPILGVMLGKGLISPQTAIFDNNGNNIGKADEVSSPYRGYRIDIWLIFCGAIAICALLLPGISGSYLLNLLGVYPVVIGALADFLSELRHIRFDQDAFFVLFSLMIGIIGGVVVFARLVSWLLKKYPDLSIAVLSGFMIGALRSVWPFWTVEYTLLPLKLQKGPQLLTIDPILPSLTSSLFLYSAIFALVGFSLVLVVEYIARVKNDNPKIQVIQ